MARRGRSDELEDLQYQDTDSDVQEQRENRVKVKWTAEEDEYLKALVKKYGQGEWKLIASKLTNRTEQQCQHRWLRVLHPDLVKGPWTKDEDEKVIELVKKYGTKHWTLIAKQLKGRMGKQCRERWHNHLNPEVKKSSWTEEEDRIIYQAHKVLGNRWAEIAKLLPGRTDNAVKNHWNSTIKRKVETGGFPNGKMSSISGEHEEKDDSGYQAVEEQDCEQSVGSSQEKTLLTTESSSESSKISPEVPHIKTEQQSEGEEAASTGSSPLSASVSVDSCPDRWMVEYVNFLIPGSTTGICETLDIMESDPERWCDLSNFDLGEESVTSEIGSPARVSAAEKPNTPNVTEYRLDGHTLSDLSKGSKGELIPISPRPQAGFGTPPSLLKLHRKRKITLSPVTENGIAGSTPVTEANSMTPKSTPVKSLPFSPSQFLNFWSKQDALELENPSLTSTPVCSQKVVVTTPLHRDKTPLGQKNAFRTPNSKLMGDHAPHTPTPFKNALEKFGSLKPLPPTPHLEEDLKEVLRSESGIELIIVDEPKHDRQRRKPVHQHSPINKVRKSLALDILDKETKPVVQTTQITELSTCTQSQGESFLSVSLNESSCSGKEENSLLNQGFVHVKTGSRILTHKADSSQIQTNIGELVRTKDHVPLKTDTNVALKTETGALLITNANTVLPVDVNTLIKNSLNAPKLLTVKTEAPIIVKMETDVQVQPTKQTIPAPMSSAWKTIAFGGSRDQLLMQEKARAFLNSYKHSSTARALILT